MRDLYDRHGWSYLGGLLLSPRNVIHVCTTFFDPHDEEQTREVYAAYDEMVLELAKVRKVPYRTNIHHMDLVADQLDFNDHIQRRVSEKIKDALDPNGILSPASRASGPRGGAEASAPDQRLRARGDVPRGARSIERGELGRRRTVQPEPQRRPGAPDGHDGVAAGDGRVKPQPVRAMA